MAEGLNKLVNGGLAACKLLLVVRLEADFYEDGHGFIELFCY